MHNLALLEESFKKFYKNIKNGPPESIIQVNLTLLYHMGLLHYHSTVIHNQSLTRYFQVIETAEKITLINDEFVIWIIPDKGDGIAFTYTLIALNKGEEALELELTFITSGVYNTSRLVLRILEKFLYDIQENEDYLNIIKKAS